MRTSWVITILFLLCFTFAGCAAGNKATGNKFITDKNKIEHVRGSDNVKVNGIEQPLQAGQVEDGKPRGRKDIDEMLNTIENKAAGDVATFYNETCWYYWNGTEWKKKCIQ